MANPDKNKPANKLIEENVDFAHYIVHKEFKKFEGSASYATDLHSAAIYGLCIAAQKYNSNQNTTKFISYAVHWIRYYVNEEIRKFAPIKLNQNYIVKRNKINRIIKDYQDNHNTENVPSVSYISALSGMSTKVVNNILKINGGKDYQFISIDSTVNNSKTDNDDVCVSDVISNETETYSCYDKVYNQENERGLEEFYDHMRNMFGNDNLDIFIDRFMNNFSLVKLSRTYNKPSEELKKIITNMHTEAKKVLRTYVSC